MDSQAINRITLLLGNKIPPSNIPLLSNMLAESNLTEQDMAVISTQMKDPVVSLILSILTGGLGIDRFYVGDVGMGVLKLITCGGLGIWTIVDIFFIMDRTRAKNWFLIMNSINAAGRQATPGPQPMTTV